MGRLIELAGLIAVREQTCFFNLEIDPGGRLHGILSQFLGEVFKSILNVLRIVQCFIATGVAVRLEISCFHNMILVMVGDRLPVYGTNSVIGVAVAGKVALNALPATQLSLSAPDPPG